MEHTVQLLDDETTECERSTSSGNNNNEFLLDAFLTGKRFDCTFKVGKTPNVKIFKCHRLILSLVSNVFDAMFYGNFKEASKGPEDPITLKDTLPDAFEASMRFIYGNQSHFGDAFVAIRVYKFAHKMQIMNLLGAVEAYIFNQMNPSNVLAIYDAFFKTGNVENLEQCRQVFLENPKEALTAMCWLHVSADTLEAVLLMDDIAVDEIDLFRALMKWGKAQLYIAGSKDDQEQTRLRTQVEPFLNLIRFESMESQQAADLCSSTKILSVDEQHAILLTTVLKDLKHLPEKFAVPEKRPIRRSNCIKSAVMIYRMGREAERARVSSIGFNFSVARKVLLVEFSVCDTFIYIKPERNILLVDKHGYTIARYYSANGETYRLTTGSSLHPSEDYILTFPSDAKKNDRMLQFTAYYILNRDAHTKIVTHLKNTYLPVSVMHFQLI